ncbi:hypothetical protein halTADL_0883 [Halohasta litchfieldiae]|jgi:hypothetical protein|uniref:DUF7123 domain-containing protein n=1 Tax=Halohasta litchfieldiae TaxID=1073996 RepID=A0A1H6TG57_9EURY|nr:hypothetical protein [Halohasta litchfieldiae]ATW87679.1 hypothetical protein halTADL_0883 [Halohasta litchfieldiae]SEI76097.1 hypothetical protein SAMN05444271_10799 [Halohasta litchfieldiae]
MSTSPTTEPQSSSLSTDSTSDLTAKQRRILDYLRAQVDSQTYFKSRLIADELDMSAKEVGANMTPLVEGDIDLSVEKWGYSSGTTWMVTA